MTQEQRSQRIKIRANMYAQGVLTLQEFCWLEEEDNAEEAALLQENKAASEEQVKAQEQEEQSAQKKQETQKDAQQDRISLVGLTKESFNALSLAEQSSLYEKAPDYVRRIVEDRPAYMDLIEPKREQRSFKETTLEEFKKMTIAELSELADTDRELYDRLQAQSTGGSK